MKRKQRVKRKERDMYLPGFICFGGLFFIVTSPLIYYYSSSDPIMRLFFFAPWFGFGAWVFLCWLNQSAWMTSEDTFIYCTTLGEKTEYRFSEIRDIKFGGKDHIWLDLENGTVPIDGSMILSRRFVKAVNAALKENTKHDYSAILLDWRFMDH